MLNFFKKKSKMINLILSTSKLWNQVYHTTNIVFSNQFIQESFQILSSTLLSGAFLSKFKSIGSL